MAKSITKKFVAISLTILMVMMGLPMDVFAEAAKSTETFASPEETINVASSDLQDGRSINFNSDWKFKQDNVSNGQSNTLDDSSWRTLDLPHDWSIEGNFTTQGEAESGFLLGGTGWYRKTFKLSEEYENKNISIEFGGVYMNCTVYVNGTELGTHPYGYTPFAFDLTKYLKYDGTNNVIAVKVNHQVPSSRWYSGSGIYRDVNLVVTDNVHVKRYGTKVTTPNLESQKGGNVTVNIETEVKNEENSSASVTVKNTVYNSSDQAVSTTVSKDATIAANLVSTISQSTSVNNPSLWSTDSPTLYYVKTQIEKNGNVIDEYTTNFGFRYFNFDRSKGFSLNGTKMKLKGVCMHHDQGALGSVANYNAIERQVKKLKKMGANAIRVTHNPASDELLEICNKEGIMIIEEAFDGWARSKNGNSNDYSNYFNATIGPNNKIMDGNSSMTWAEFDIKQMVDRGKNNPCIIMWSLGNEILEGASTSTDSNYATYAQNLINWVKEIDTTRPTTIGDNNSKNSNSTYLAVSNVIANNGGIVGLNYSSDSQYSSLYNNHSNWKIYGSETSSAVRSRGIYTTKSTDNTNHQVTSYDKYSVDWGRLAADSWSSIITNDYIAGEFVWTGFDYIGEPTPWNKTNGSGSATGNGPSPNSSYFGIIDTAGFEKDIYYFYQSQWNDNVNTLHILPCWDIDSISLDNGYAEVVVYSDAPTVELFLNGKSLGKKSFDTSTTAAGYKYKTNNGAYYLTWNVKYESGTLSAKAYDENGKEITNTQGRNSVTTSGTPSKLNATAEKSTIDADGYDLSYISVDVTDANGNIDPNASNQINFKLTGNGKIVGVDNGDATETSKFKPTSSTSASIKAFSGKALVIVQSTKEAGGFTLTASSGNLQSSSVSVNTRRVLDDTSSNEITSYKISKDYYVYQNVTPKLPTTVKATYTDKTTKDVKVNWENYDKNLLKQPNVFTVKGTLEGTDIEVIVNVHVVGNVVAALNYSTNTTAGVKPVLPEKVASVLEDGTVSEEFAVTWDDIAESKYSSVGTFVVNGSVTILDKTYNVTASVRVDKEAEESKNIALNINSDAPTLSQSVPEGNNNQSDNLYSINNGTYNSSTESERWTNYNYRNTESSAYVQMDWKNDYTMKGVKLYFFTDSFSAQLPQKIQIDYWNGSDFVNIVSSVGIPVTDTDKAIEFEFNKVVKTNKLRVTLTEQSGHCIGLTEMEVFSVPESNEANTTALLSKLNVNGSSVDSFDAETKDYTVSVNEDSEISVTAESKDNAAVTVLPEFNNIIKVLVQSEDHQTINTYNIKLERKSEPVKGADKSQLKTALAKANDILSVENNKNIYTESTYNALKDARDAGQDVFDNNLATQAEVDKAIEDINNAIAGLKEKEVSGLSVSLSSDGQRIIVTGKVDRDAYDYSKITKHGILYIRQSNLENKELTVNTPGRTRVNFGTYKEDGSFIYRFNPYDKDALYTARTFIQYKDANGKTCYEYSDMVSGSVFGLQQ